MINWGTNALRALFARFRFVRSPMGLRAFYIDKALLDREVLEAYVRPLVGSRALANLRGIAWALVDALRERHRDIAADVLFLWGEDDPTFPVEPASAMVRQFEREPRFVRITGASLLPHEERSVVVGEQILRFASTAQSCCRPSICDRTVPASGDQVGSSRRSSLHGRAAHCHHRRFHFWSDSGQECGSERLRPDQRRLPDPPAHRRFLLYPSTGGAALSLGLDRRG